MASRVIAARCGVEARQLDGFPIKFISGETVDLPLLGAN
jgi:hypothetical protein